MSCNRLPGNGAGGDRPVYHPSPTSVQVALTVLNEQPLAKYTAGVPLFGVDGRRCRWCRSSSRIQLPTDGAGRQTAPRPPYVPMYASLWRQRSACSCSQPVR